MNSLNPWHKIWLERGKILGQWLLLLRSVFRHRTPAPVKHR